MDRKRPIKTGFHRSGPVFLSSKIKVDRSRSRSFNFGPKDRTGLDLQTLRLGAKLNSKVTIFDSCLAPIYFTACEHI